MSEPKRKARWYFGGLSSALAACFTHPLDLIKVQLQTQQDKKVSILQLTKNIVKNDGIMGLYNGLSASLLRQLTYSTARFAMYEVGKNWLSPTGEQISLPKRILLAAGAGATGGFIGTPADMVNVRMQNDNKLPPNQRRNYKHAVDGLIRVLREEGVIRCFSGASSATSRAVLMTVGQLSFYDQFKMLLLNSNFKDNTSTHFLSSFLAGAVATVLTQPIDVIKTRAMNAKPGEFSNMFAIVKHTAKLGPLGFYKGIVPAFVRIAPHTIMTFMLWEQMTIHFGIVEEPKKK